MLSNISMIQEKKSPLNGKKLYKFFMIYQRYINEKMVMSNAQTF